MKRFYFFIFLIFLNPQLFSQNDPVAYLESIGQDNNPILESTWDYFKALARDKKPQNVEGKRKELVIKVKKSLDRIKKLPGYQGNTAYRDSTISMLQFNYDIMEGKASKFVDMEKIAQKSYDGMEAYIFMMKELNELMDKKSDMLSLEQIKFADKYKVNLINSPQTKLEKNVNVASKIFNYKDLMYLTFFRCSVYETALMEALSKNSEEFNYQNASFVLAELVAESKKAMDTIQDVSADVSLREGTKRALNFFDEEASQMIPVIVEYNKINNDFNAFKKEFDVKSTKSKEDVDKYNAFVKNLNTASTKLNNKLTEFNRRRTGIYDMWNKTADSFVIRNVPK